MRFPNEYESRQDSQEQQNSEFFFVVVLFVVLWSFSNV
jgi:hypothetical protein